jgi:hypothetical protein
MRVSPLALALILVTPAPTAAEWQIKPFLGITWGGSTTFVDAEQAAGSPNVVYGASGLLLGEIFGLEADFGRAPGFFQRGFFGTGSDNPVPPGGVAGGREFGSSITTLTGNVVVAMPRRLTEFTLRPYFVGGAGMMHVAIDDLGALPVASTLAAANVGGGLTGFLSRRTGVSWEVRRFWSVGGTDRAQGFSFGPEQLSFWRASMALAFRY